LERGKRPLVMAEVPERPALEAQRPRRQQIVAVALRLLPPAPRGLTLAREIRERFRRLRLGDVETRAGGGRRCGQRLERAHQLPRLAAGAGADQRVDRAETVLHIVGKRGPQLLVAREHLVPETLDPAVAGGDQQALLARQARGMLEG